MLLCPTREKRKWIGDCYPPQAIVVLVAVFLIAAITVTPLAPVFAQSLDGAATTNTDQSVNTQSEDQSSTVLVSDQASSSDAVSSTPAIEPTPTASSSANSSSSIITVEPAGTDNSSTSSGQNQTSSWDVASDTSVIAPTSTSSSSIISDNSASGSESLNTNSSTASSSLTAGAVIPESHSPKTTKFKRNNSLSEDAQLAAVRQHLIDSGLPQEIIDRVDAYKTAEQQGPQQPGLLTKITDFITGNTDAQKAQKKIEDLAKQQPFKVGTYSGPINTASESSYDQTFSNKQEGSGGLLGKIINFFKAGTLKNLNFDNTKTTAPLSWFLGQKALAVSDNPSDYLAAGNEITFSQAIQDKADALNHDPLSILNFVRNNITYVPYYGSKKGSDATLIEQAGNDTDKASLLIAMLRYSEIPARYRQVDSKMDIGTVTDLLGVHSANAAALVLSLEQIPYILYTDNSGNPLFFVIEHTYVEAYVPYGYSRGVNMNDGGTSQWVPMDPSINAYYYEQPVDIVSQMKANGFQIEQFFDNYLNAGSSTLEPIEAFKSSIEDELASHPPTYYPNLTYDDALMRSYSKNQNLSFIPGSLPYEIAANLDTYDYMPTSFRHTITFNAKDDQNNTVLNYTGYVSDLADRELLMTYNPASQADQDTLDTFDTIYDVVPLSLVAVKPVITVNGTAVATGSASTTLGQAQSYTMEFDTPTRDIGGSITSNAAETINRSVIAGNTDAIALDTDRVVPSGIRPEQDTQTTSFVANQALYNTGVDFLYRLQGTQGELASITGGDFTNTATRATIFNGIDVTYASSGQPYSFSWKGLRIDSSSKVKYFNRLNADTTTHFKEFTAVFGLQASQEESNIFEDNFNVDSIATVKGLKLVSAGTFSGITLHKITSANEGDIDSLSISTSTKSVFHTAVQAGKTVYTPSAQLTYNNWTGLVYVTIDFNGGVAGFIIGEGLNGGYTTLAFANGLQDFFINVPGTFSSLTATIVNPTNNQTFAQGDFIQWRVDYAGMANATSVSWTESSTLSTLGYPPGIYTISSQYGTTSTVSIYLQKEQLGTTYVDFDDKIISIASDTYHIPPDLMKSMVYVESFHPKDETPPMGSTLSDPRGYRYEAHIDYDWYSRQSPSVPSELGWRGLGNDPEKHFVLQGHVLTGQSVEQGNQVPSDYLEWSEHTNGGPLEALHNGTGHVTAATLVQNNQKMNWPDRPNWNFTAQLLLAASYGLGQTLYETAITMGFDNRTGNRQFVRPIQELFDPTVSIDLSANYLKQQLDEFPGWETNTNQLREALLAYNGGSDPTYDDDVIAAWNNGNGKFKLMLVSQ